MTVTITGAKHTGTVSSYSSRQLTCSGVTFLSASFARPRIIGLWDSSVNYRGMAWVRRWISSTVLEVESDFIDKDGNTVTPVSTNVALVSLDFTDAVTTGLAVANSIVTLTDNVIFGTAADSDSVCFYDEAKQILVTDDVGDRCLRFYGGLTVFGHLRSYTDRTFFNSVDLYSADGGNNGDQIASMNLAAKMWWLGGKLQFGVTPARFPGGFAGTPAEFQKWWGIETNGDVVTPNGGAAWSSNPTYQQFINVASIISTFNSIGFRLANSDAQGGSVKITGGDCISAFGADANGTFNLGAPAGQRFIIYDIGTVITKTAFWRSDSTYTQTIVATNIISTNYRMGTTAFPGTTPNNNASLSVKYKDTYSNLLATTKVYIKEANNLVLASTGTSSSGESLSLNVLYATGTGHILTVNETDWIWGAITYATSIVSGSFSVADVATLDGTAKNVSHGAILAQVSDLLITEANKTTVDAYTTIDNENELYDRAKSYLYTNYAGEDSPIVSRVGRQIDIGSKDLVINATAASAFAFATNTVTIKTSTYTGGATATTGTITTLNGALLDGGTFDCDINYQSGASTTISNIICTGVIDFNTAGTYTIDACTIQEVTNSSGGAVLLDTINGSTVFVNTGPNITISTPPVSVTINSSESGSLIQIFDTGTTTIIDSTTGSTLNYEHAGETVDIVVQKAGFIHQRSVGVVLSGTFTIDFTLIADLNYVASHGLVYTTDYTISIATDEIDVLTATTGQDVYSAVIDSFIAGDGDTLNKTFPLSMNGPSTLLMNGIEFTSTSIDYLSRTGFSYIASGVTVAVYAAIQTTTLPASTKFWRLSSDGGTWVLQHTGTAVDSVLQVYGDASHGTIDVQDFLTFKATNDGYTVGEWNLIADGGVTEITSLFYFVPLSISETGEATGDPSVTGVTVTNISDTSWNGITVGVNIEADGVTGSEIMRYLTWERHQGNLLNFGQLVEPIGDDYRAVRGRVYDGSPLAVEGVRVILAGGTDPHPDFVSFDGNTGTYTPPVTAEASITGIEDGSRLQIFNVTTDTEEANEIISGTSYSLIYSNGTTYTAGDVIRVRLTYADSTTAKVEFEATAIATASGWSVVASQVDCPIYASFAASAGYGGDFVTGFDADYTDTEVDVTTSSNFYLSDWWMWWKYNLTTEDGVSTFFKGVTAIDSGNFQINSSKVNINFDNVTASEVYALDNRRVYRTDGLRPVKSPTTGGAGIDLEWRDKVLIAETGVSGLTPEESAKLNAIAPDLVVINNGVKKASKLIPHNEDL